MLDMVGQSQLKPAVHIVSAGDKGKTSQALTQLARARTGPSHCFRWCLMSKMSPYHHGINLTSDFRFPFLAVLGPEMGPDRPNFKSYCVLDQSFTVASRPGPFRLACALPAKSAPAKNTNFALDGDNRFMRPSWVRAHGPIFGKVYIVWVCAPAYKPLSPPRSRIQENRT